MSDLLILAGIFTLAFFVTRFVLKSGGIAGGC
jgi:hypothetical protein